MELRSCSHLHFIQAIRGGLVIKLRNVHSPGGPALVFKRLKEIYEIEDAKNRGTSSKLKSSNGHSDIVFECDRVRTECPCLPMVDRTTREVDCETNGHSSSDSDEEKDGNSYDHSFEKITLKQLKESCKTKKRKFTPAICLSPKQELTDLQPEDDEFDLKEPLSCWKLKLSKNSKPKRRRINKSASVSSKIARSVKPEPVQDAEGSLPSNANSAAPIHVKAEVPEPEYSECQNIICFANDSSINGNKQASFCGVVSGEILETNERDVNNREPISFREENQRCIVNEVSYDFLDHVENSSFLSLTAGEIVETDNIERNCQQSLIFPSSEFNKEEYVKHPLSQGCSLEMVSPTKDQISGICNSSQSCSYLHDFSEQSSSDSIVQVPHMIIDNTLCCKELTYEDDLCISRDDVKKDMPLDAGNGSLSSPFSYCGSSLNAYPCSGPDNDLVSLEDNSPNAEESQPLISTIADEARIFSNTNKDLVFLENKSPTTEKQPLISPTAETERKSSAGSHTLDAANGLSTSEIKNNPCIELRQPPERLLSTRKAISPNPQERLCLAMNSIDLYDDDDDHKCKEKLCFGKKIDIKDSPEGSTIKSAELTVNSNAPDQVNRTKATISPKQILRKVKNNKRFSPPKGCFEGPCLSRTLPRVSTGCTSIEVCSESAIAFSQRQMHDIESLAMKLMNELKSMKDIVEEKLLYEAYRSTSLKNGADEVKTAIKNATKVEETGRKWLSMMTRDCNRFCKIMRFTENDATASKNTTYQKKKKITFADETGGMLCHVKFFEDGMNSLESDMKNKD